MSTDVRALSLLQPWPDAFFDGGKPLENRVSWRYGSHFRGPFLIHASKRSAKTRDEYIEAIRFCERRRITWRPNPLDELQCGGIVGRARVIGVVTATGHVKARVSESVEITRPMTETEDLWWMGGFALVLADVERVPFVPCAGALGFWRVPPEVVAMIGKAVA